MTAKGKATPAPTPAPTVANSYATAIFYSSTVGAVPDETAPVIDPYEPSMAGWYFAKDDTMSTAKINWYFCSSFVTGNPLNPGTITFGEVTAQWAVVTFYEFPTDQAPYFALYTAPKGSCAVPSPPMGCKFYDFRVEYFLAVPFVPVTGKVFVYTEVDPGVHPEILTRLQLTEPDVAYGGIDTPDLSSSDTIILNSIQTASNEGGPISMVVEGVGYTSTGSFQGNFALKFDPLSTQSPTSSPDKDGKNPKLMRH